MTSPQEQGRRSIRGGYLAVPNFFIDDLMPSLGDTEWRLLLIILRQTYGQSVGPSGARKRRDWMSQSQLQARTGRASEAISRALDSLVASGLVVVEAHSGSLLDSRELRRSHGGRCYYRVSDELLSPNKASQQIAYSDLEHGNPNTTKERLDKRKVIDIESNDSNVARASARPVRIYSGWQRAGDLASRRKLHGHVSTDTDSSSAA